MFNYVFIILTIGIPAHSHLLPGQVHGHIQESNSIFQDNKVDYLAGIASGYAGTVFTQTLVAVIPLAAPVAVPLHAMNIASCLELALSPITGHEPTLIHYNPMAYVSSWLDSNMPLETYYGSLKGEHNSSAFNRGKHDFIWARIFTDASASVWQFLKAWRKLAVIMGKVAQATSGPATTIIQVPQGPKALPTPRRPEPPAASTGHIAPTITAAKPPIAIPTTDPKDTIHFIWLGSSFARQETFRKNVEEYKESLDDSVKIKLWTDNMDPETQRWAEQMGVTLIGLQPILPHWLNEELHEHYNKAARQLPPNYGKMSDMIRYFIMYHEGGTYLDVDVTMQSLGGCGVVDFAEECLKIYSDTDFTPQSLGQDDKAWKHPAELWTGQLGWVPGTNDRLYSAQVNIPFWLEIITEMSRRLNLPFKDQVLMRKPPTLTKYSGWSTVICSGPRMLESFTANTHPAGFGFLVAKDTICTGSWLGGPRDFAKKWTPRTEREEREMLIRISRCIEDAFEQGKVKLLHYLPVIERFQHINREDAIEQLLTQIEQSLTNLAPTAEPIKLIYVSTAEQFDRIYKAIPQDLRQSITRESWIRANMKALKFRVPDRPEDLHDLYTEQLRISDELKKLNLKLPILEESELSSGLKYPALPTYNFLGQVLIFSCNDPTTFRNLLDNAQPTEERASILFSSILDLLIDSDHFTQKHREVWIEHLERNSKYYRTVIRSVLDNPDKYSFTRWGEVETYKSFLRKKLSDSNLFERLAAIAQ